MTNNQDARPFVDLKKDAAEFRAKFDEDIEECLKFLDSRITSLICDPESFGTDRGSLHQNALAEFSKAKYDIFISVKSFINRKEREWLDYIAEMKKLFIENVEIFLAGTKLEVKLPSSESAPSSSLRKSPGNRKSISTVSSSIYPLITSITRNIPVLGTSFQENEASSSSTRTNVGGKTQFNRRGRLSSSSIKFAVSPYEEEMDVDKAEFNRSRSHSSSSISSKKLSNAGLNTSRSSSERRSSLKKDMDLGLNRSWSSSERRSSLKKDMNFGLNEKTSTVVIQNDTISNSNDVFKSASEKEIPSKARRCARKLVQKDTIAENKSQEKKNDFENQVVLQSTDIQISETVSLNQQLPQKMRGRRGKSIVHSSTENVVSQSNSSSNEDITIERSELKIPLKGRRGRLAQKYKGKDEPVVAQSSCSSNDEIDDKSSQTVENKIPLKGQRGKAVQKTKAIDLLVVTQNNCNNIDETEDQTSQISENKIPVKGRRGKTLSKTKTVLPPPNDLVVKDIDGINEDQPVEEKTRRGRSTASNNASKVSDQNVRKAAGKGRRATKSVIEEEEEEEIHEPDQNVRKIAGRSQRATKSVVEEEIHKPDRNVRKATGKGRRATKSVVEEEEEEIREPEPSPFSKRVSFSADNSSSDELDIQTPLARPVKSGARRKTLLPNLEDLSDADIIPGAASRSKAKRKTFCGASEVKSMAPSKRLKVSQKSSSSQEEDNANDNLLESDGNYSEWMALKSADGKIPTHAAIYELKVWRAKKPAYIGCCESLRHKLTLYKLKQNSGHKHLDKFIERNFDDIQVRYEIVSSFNDAKGEVMNRIKKFVDQHKTTPAYN